MALIGSIDGAYYHTYKFALYKQPSSRVETVTHIIRAFSMAFVVWILAHYTPMGDWFWAGAIVFAIDMIDDIVDVLVEPSSRAPMGGLPTFEYLIHMLVMACAGGAWTTFVVLGWGAQNEPTALLPFASNLPEWVLWLSRLVAVGALLTGIGDTIQLTRSVMRDGWARPSSTDSHQREHA